MRPRALLYFWSVGPRHSLCRSRTPGASGRDAQPRMGSQICHSPRHHAPRGLTTMTTIRSRCRSPHRESGKSSNFSTRRESARAAMSRVSRMRRTIRIRLDLATFRWHSLATVSSNHVAHGRRKSADCRISPKWTLRSRQGGKLQDLRDTDTAAISDHTFRGCACRCKCGVCPTLTDGGWSASFLPDRRERCPGPAPVRRQARWRASLEFHQLRFERRPLSEHGCGRLARRRRTAAETRATRWEPGFSLSALRGRLRPMGVPSRWESEVL